MPHSAASDLGHHCLPMSHKKDARLIRVKMKSQKPKRVISQGFCCRRTLQVPFLLKSAGLVSVTDLMGDPVQSSKLKVSNSETIVRKLNALFYSRKFFVNLWYKLQTTDTSLTNNLNSYVFNP